MFAVTMLRRTLLKTQWISLVTLVAGVVLVQLANTDSPKAAVGGPEQNRVIGFSAALCACLLSGFAGIYFEKILKGKKFSCSDMGIYSYNHFVSLIFFVSYRF